MCLLLVRMPMSVLDPWFHRCVMFVLVVFVMDMLVFMLHDLPFGKLLATPTDGRPVTMWPNIDQAFLDVVNAIKRALNELGQKAKPTRQTVPQPGADVPASPLYDEARSSNLRVKKRFTDLDRDRFRHGGFEYIAKFFENSLRELTRRNPGLDQTFRRIDANTFIAAAYVDGEKVCKGSVSVSGRNMGGDAIEYSMSDEHPGHGMNGNERSLVC